MSSAKKSMRLTFPETDSRFGITRDTLRALSSALGIPQAGVVHLALVKLAQEMRPAHLLDDGPLTASQVAALRRDAEQFQSKGKVLQRTDRFN